MKRILIADPSEEQCAAIANALRGKYAYRICHDGLTAQRLLRDYSPDTVILELRLQGIDGLTLLEEMDQSIRPAVLVYTGCRTDYVDDRLQLLCDYAMYKPGDLTVLVDRLEDVINRHEGRQYILDPDDPAQIILQKLIHRPWRYGYRYLAVAIHLYAQDPMQAVTKELYPNIARRFHTSSSCVEKAIRCAIHQAWEERDNDIWRQYFFTDRTGQVCKPSNREFLNIVARQIVATRRRA